MRPRIKVKPGLQGSSDFRRVMHRKSRLEKSHQEFLKSELHIALLAVPVKEPSPDTLVRPWNPFKQCFDTKKMPYSIVKSAGCKWSY